MVKAADRTKGHVMMMSCADVNALPCMIGWGGRISVHDRLGSMTMLRDPVGCRVPAHDRLERMADDRVQDDQPMHRDPEREPFTHRTS